MSGYSSSSRPMGLTNSTSTTSTAHSSSQAPTSSPVSSPPSLTHSASSSGSPTSERRSNGNPAATLASNALKQLGRPSESDYLSFEHDLLDPENASIAVTSMHEFLAAMDKAVVRTPIRYDNPRANLQAFLIQMQLVAGIPPDQIQPMPEFAPKSNQRVVQRRSMPAYLTISSDGTFVPQIPPAQFNGAVDLLPFGAGLPNPDWVSLAKENFSRQMGDDAANSTTAVNTPGQEPAQGMVELNNARSEPAENEENFSTYFSSDQEQQEISQFFVAHFSTGSGILNLESAEVDDPVDDGTDSDYNTDDWSDTNDAA